ncbi:MAG TPA: hypothetical protein VK943_03940 [Arenibaculum sp.]|nr:hypothetical protein [Arenibaculum sp.]
MERTESDHGHRPHDTFRLLPRVRFGEAAPRNAAVPEAVGMPRHKPGFSVFLPSGAFHILKINCGALHKNTLIVHVAASTVAGHGGKSNSGKEGLPG